MSWPQLRSAHKTVGDLSGYSGQKNEEGLSTTHHETSNHTMEVTPVHLHGTEKSELKSPQPTEPESDVAETSSKTSMENTSENTIPTEFETAARANDKDTAPVEEEDDDYDPFEPEVAEPIALTEEKPVQESSQVSEEQKEEEIHQESANEPTGEPTNEPASEQAAEASHQPENESPQQEQLNLEVSIHQETNEETSKPEDNEADEDEYDPEAVQPETEVAVPSPETKEVQAQPSIPENPVNNVGLPAKPTHQPQDSSVKLKEAYEAIMQSDVVKDPLFTSMSPEDQMNTIQRLLQERNISLPQLDTPAIDPDMNYDQVYSYNKPFKNIKDPIPLVPVGKFCRRPNITVPMSRTERAEYESFLSREAQYSGYGSLDDLPENLRLFIGNLPANTITKEDLFRIFSKYGEVLQISIKAGYGFIQYRTAEACSASIKGETNVPLHNKYMRLAASKSQKSRAPGPRGREREGEFGDDREPKRRRTTDCQLIRNEETSGPLFSEVEAVFRRADISYNIVDASGKNVSDEVREAAYSGVIGACVVKDSRVDLQIFEETADGGIKFDEYLGVEPDTVLDVIGKARASRHPPPPPPRDPYQNDRRRDSRRSDSYHGSAHPSRGDNRNSGRHPSWQRSDREWSQPSRPPQRNQWSRHDNRGYNEPSYPPNQYGGPQNYNQDFGPQRGYNQGYPPNSGYGQQMPPGPPQGYQNSGYPPQQGYQGYQGGPPPMGPPQNFSQPGGYNGPQQKADPALLQTLQNLDPSAMQNVISLLQQQNKGPSPQIPNAQPQYQGYGQSPPPPPNVSQPNQINSLLSSLQSSQGNYNSNPQQQQGQTPSSSLMDMLARLGK